MIRLYIEELRGIYNFFRIGMLLFEVRFVFFELDSSRDYVWFLVRLLSLAFV